jgi:predicted transcriptional regulator YdeE
MEPKLIQEKALLLAGLSFYGDPFANSDPWSEENQIGRLWARLMQYIQDPGDDLDWDSHGLPFYEVHLFGPETETHGLFEVFVGMEIAGIEHLPYGLVAKHLPACRYAIFTLEGQAILGDWEREILAWLDANNYREAYSFNFQYYDQRFKGLDPVDESVIDVYVPVEAQQ